MSRQKTRILIIDDEVDFGRLLKLNLEQTGAYEVRLVHEGREGLAAAQAFVPDVILLDIVMPDRDGTTVAADITSDARLKDTPLVFLTATVTHDETTAHDHMIGSYPFLAKPATVEEIVACIEQQLRR